jgi:ATP-dependent RNA helicase DDX51/DBP6
MEERQVPSAKRQKLTVEIEEPEEQRELEAEEMPVDEPETLEKAVRKDIIHIPPEKVDIDRLTFEIHPKLMNNLKKSGIVELFPVQHFVIPYILRGRDVGVCAPTGSGKTLSYLIPIIQSLIGRSVVRLRALIVLPTRDLAEQVYQVALQFCKGTGIKCAAIYGHVPFKVDQETLIDGEESAVDVVIATPGRLVDHLRETNRFTLQHLRFLVIDEADRLQMESFQDWIAKVLDSAYNSAEALPRIENR